MHPTSASLVSVIVPTYNRSGLLARALDSALSQTHSALQVIVVDDGSTDDTETLVKAQYLTDTRVEYVYQTNQRLAAAKNTGIAHARGSYITFLDSDDAYEPDHIALRAAYMDEHLEIDAIHGGFRPVNGGYMVPDYYAPGQMFDLRGGHLGPTLFMRAHTPATVGGFIHRDYGEDTEFFERATNTVRTARVDWPTYLYYRDSSDSIVNNEQMRRDTSSSQPQ